MSEVQNHAMLTPTACQTWTRQVLACQKHWTQRHTVVPFYTLGMAAYLDCKQGAGRASSTGLYHQRILRYASNAMLMAHFEPLYQSLCECIARIYDMPVALIPEQAAVPGFHIHLPHAAFANDVASIHRDLQFQQVFPSESFNPSQVITFTLPLSLPEGSGLHMWQGDVKTFYPYEVGQLVIHSGLLTHHAVLRCAGRVSPSVTLQWLGVQRNNNSALYW